MKKTIICFGDSNTYGFDTKTMGRFDEHTRWPGVLSDLLGEDYAVKEEGLPGRTAVFNDPLNEGMNGYWAISPVLHTHAPVHLLIIMLGTNDVKQRFSATAPNIRLGQEQLVKKALFFSDCFENGKPEILLVCPPPILPVYRERIFADEMGEGCDVKSRALAPLLRDTAKALGVHFLDAGEIPGVTMSAEYCGMHMQGDSHKKLGAAIAEWIQNR